MTHRHYSANPLLASLRLHNSGVVVYGGRCARLRRRRLSGCGGSDDPRFTWQLAGFEAIEKQVVVHGLILNREPQ